MKKITTIAVILLAVILVWQGCKKKEDLSEKDNIIIYGNVIDRVTGDALYNVLIQEKNKIGGSVATGTDGNYEFTLPLNDNRRKFYLLANKDKYSTSEYELDISQADNNRRIKVDFQLNKEFITYTGIVSDSKNQPISDVQISAKYTSSEDNVYYNIGTATITGANGTYQLELPQPADKEQWKLAIIASKDGYLNKTHILNQNTGDMGKTIPLNFIMETYGITISGRVTDFYGHPISNASILDWVDYDGYSEWKLVSTTQTNSNGEYQLVVPSTYIIKEGNVTRNCRYHTFKCKYADYPTQSQKLYTADSDNGKSYTFNFTLKYEWEF